MFSRLVQKRCLILLSSLSMKRILPTVMILLSLGLAILLPGCCTAPTPPPCGLGADKNRDIALNKAVQGEGAVFYHAFGDVLDPDECPGSVTGLQINDANDLAGFKVNLIIHHKIPDDELSVIEIMQDPNLYIPLDPGDSLSDGELQDLFDNDLEFPIDHQLTAVLTSTIPNINLPERVYVKLEWFD